MDMIRLGIGLYGLYPSEESKQWGIRLAEALSLKSCLSHVKEVPAGTSVSYGHTWTASRPSVIGTVPIGYADGVSRLLSNRGSVLVGGQRVPIIGRVCMDQLMVDLTGLPEAKQGQPVVLMGQQGTERIPVDEVAALLNTINYEIVCDLSCRLPRRYVNA
jgi:alanine racemase